MQFTDKITLTGSHSLIAQHKFEKVPVEEHTKIKETASVSKFGLFNTTSPNLNTYYPNTDLKDIQPKDEDFIYPIFRVLSKNTLNKFGPIDFSDGDVLKDSMKDLVGQTLYTEHEDIVGNHVGVVMDVFWQEEFNQDGVRIPAGINAILKVDAKSNPKIARGILMDPPAVHSASVSVFYKWKKSHEDMETDEFYNKLGTFDKDGNLVRKVATKIILYTELSLVPHGADPFAQVQKNGKISNPDFAKKFHDLAVNGKFAYMDYKRATEDSLEVEISSFKYESDPNKQFNYQNEKEMKEFLLKLAKAANLPDQKEESLNESSVLKMVTDKLSENLENEQAYAKEITGLTNTIKEKEGEIETFKTQLENYSGKEQFFQIGEEALTQVREKAKAAYLTLKGDKKDENILKLIGNSDFEAVKSLLSDYETELNEKVPLKCTSCGSDSFSRSTSQRDGDQDGDSGKISFKPNHEVMQNRKKSKFSVSRIHGE